MKNVVCCVLLLFGCDLWSQSVEMKNEKYRPGMNGFSLSGGFWKKNPDENLLSSGLDSFFMWYRADYSPNISDGDVIEVITQDGKAWRERLAIHPVTEESDYFSWAPVNHFVSLEGQPIGYRLGKLLWKKEDGKIPRLVFDSYYEQFFGEPGPAPHLKAEVEDDRTLVWEIGPALSSSCQHLYSLDGGKTWKNMPNEGRSTSTFFEFTAEDIQTNQHPMIKFVAYHRMRRYVKYYTFGKGYHDAPEEAPAMPVASSGKPGAQAKKPSKPAPPKGR